MRDSDLSAARKIVQAAFGTFFGAPNPESFMADRDHITTRWRGGLGGAFAAENGEGLVGSNFLTNWGSFGFFGPLTVRPDLWDQKIAQRLLEPTMDLFDSWGVKSAGLFTFAHSAKHVGLYQKFGFWPQFLTALMSKAPQPGARVEPAKFSSLDQNARDEAIRACRELTGDIFEGLDLTREILSVERQKLGDTLLVWGGDRLEAFAVCHCGEGTEAGRESCYLKFAAARGPKEFERLLDACDAFALELGMKRIEAGMNLARREAYNALRQRGYRTNMQGVAMLKPDSPAFNRAGVYVIDDWR
ncbi:MAG: GNAT family N-acetyltransferase [Bryobacteraceae bacterium]